MKKEILINRGQKIMSINALRRLRILEDRLGIDEVIPLLAAVAMQGGARLFSEQVLREIRLADLFEVTRFEDVAAFWGAGRKELHVRLAPESGYITYSADEVQKVSRTLPAFWEISIN